MRRALVRRQIGATEHGNENQRYDLLSPAHAAAGSMVLEWYEIHKDELLQDWELIRTTGEFNKIQPLE